MINRLSTSIRPVVVDENKTRMKGRHQAILFLGEQQAIEEYVRWLKNAGTDVQAIDSPSKLPQAIRKHNPVAVVIDLSANDSELEYLEQVAPVTSELGSAIRVVFISTRADQEVRIRAVQAGGDAFLTRPVMPQLLMQQLDPLLFMASRASRILIIGDLPGGMKGLDEELQEAGVSVKMIGNSSQLLLSVINFSPDLLIVAQQLDGRNAEELGRVIHQLADYEDLPVVYLDKSGTVGHGKIDPASEWLCPESIAPRELVARIDKLISTARVRRNRIMHLQTCDPVTGLLNRQGFFPMLERGVVATDAAGMILLDLENIQHGYPELSPGAMNELIVKVSGLLSRLAAPVDLAARVSDYCFAFLVSRESREEISKLGQFLSHSVSSRIFDTDKHSLTLGCSVGIAVTLGNIENGMPLFTLALKSCHEARAAGVNRVSMRSLEAVGEDRVSDADRRVLELLQDSAEKGRFSLVFQPIASLRGNAIEKYEVLLRMRDENDSMISPTRFVPIADKHGLMQSIDRWVVKQTVERLENRANGTRFFVKLASGTVRDQDFITFVKDCLDESDVSAEKLVFEISRANITAGIRYASNFAARITELGCEVSLDHSDISQDIAHLFEHIPASFVRLDGSVVTDICDDPVKQEQLRAVIRQSEKQDARIIAGYIENAHCLQLLWQSGVHYIQGNFLQEPDESLDFDFGAGSG